MNEIPKLSSQRGSKPVLAAPASSEPSLSSGHWGYSSDPIKAHLSHKNARMRGRPKNEPNNRVKYTGVVNDLMEGNKAEKRVIPR